MRLVLDGMTHILVLSSETLSRMESDMGCGVMVLAEQLAAGMLSLRALARIAASCLEPAYAGDDLPQALLRCGMGEVNEALAEFFLTALSGAREAPNRCELAELMARFPDKGADHSGG